MPMGNSDRIKKYISDYLENKLDPTTRKEFDEELKASPELGTLTDKISNLSSQLNNLHSYKCSEDFSMRLRERIHSDPQTNIFKHNVVRYSLAISFVVVFAIAAFNFIDFSTATDVSPGIQRSSQIKLNNSNPASNPLSGNKTNSYVNDGELDIKTAPNATADSTGTIERDEKRRENRSIKYVHDKKK